MGKDQLHNMEIFDKDFLKMIDLQKVCQGFKQEESFEELKEDKIFRTLFKNIGDEIHLEDTLVDFGDEFITTYTRDIFLLTKWYESMLEEGKTKKFADNNIDRLVNFYVYLLRYVGESLHDLSFSSIQEVFEVWIIKSMITHAQISPITNSMKRFLGFLEKNKVKNIRIELLDEKEISNLKRVAQEFKMGAWRYNNEDYLDWRDRNIKYYM